MPRGLGILRPSHEPTILHLTKLICVFWPVTQKKQLRFCRPDFKGPHKELALVETVKSI